MAEGTEAGSRPGAAAARVSFRFARTSAPRRPAAAAEERGFPEAAGGGRPRGGAERRRPGQPAEEARYDVVPVAAYGRAVLRRLGWEPGRTSGRAAPPRASAPRPPGLGLGARPAGAPGQAGGALAALPGPGLRGKAQGPDPAAARAAGRLAAGSRAATVGEHCLRPVTGQEFPEHAPRPRPARAASSAPKALGREDARGRPEGSERKEKRPAGPAAQGGRAAGGARHWLRRDLRVRCVDKLHEGGRYYNTKMKIEDVPSPDSCVCRTDEGRVLEGLREDMLETLCVTHFVHHWDKAPYMGNLKGKFYLDSQCQSKPVPRIEVHILQFFSCTTLQCGTLVHIWMKSTSNSELQDPVSLYPIVLLAIV
ncbi:PREDICTED: G patch domain and KOW motifs-containing protein-like isoform X2 [Chinchilla lanigera]|uniref:G patch domain and KOW motifs-containing protein-like isoform X2 n=1 Tax=Chinchilla lanigera TaxID=34839 RepID=UPI000696262C|nr:PREDICTED: G patch domain and KOW motifs-containing protein-like isoform X2 [Chinchilla lanigera]